MKRKDFLKSIGAAGIGLSLPASQIAKSVMRESTDQAIMCTLIPSLTAGPFPLDLTENTEFFRQDVTEGKAGTPLNLKLKIVGVENCEPMSNVRVNIWSCDKDGNYSGYGTQVGETQFRGYQWTDANGEVSFKTIVPGWYPGRVCHIHFQVWVNSSYSAVSQLTFDSNVVNQAYEENSAVYVKGDDPLTPQTDGIFEDDHELFLATLAKDESTGEYNSYMEIGVQGSGTVGVSHIEQQTAKHIEMGQNFPNPYTEKTNIPYELHTASEVTFDLYNLGGQKVYTQSLGRLAAGQHNIALQMSELNLKVANYVYQISIINAEGTFKTVKMMTAN